MPVWLISEVQVWFPAGQGSAGIPHRSIPSHFEPWTTHRHSLLPKDLVEPDWFWKKKLNCGYWLFCFQNLRLVWRLENQEHLHRNPHSWTVLFIPYPLRVRRMWKMSCCWFQHLQLEDVQPVQRLGAKRSHSKHRVQPYCTCWLHTYQSFSQSKHINKKPSSISLGWPTVLAVSDLQDHRRSMIFLCYLKATSYFWLIVTLAVSLTVSKIWPVFRWKMHIFPYSPPFSRYENVPPALDGWNYARPSLTQMTNYSHKQVFLYDLKLSHDTSTSVTDGQTNRWTKR